MKVAYNHKREMEVERVSNFDIKKKKKHILIFIIILACLFISNEAYKIFDSYRNLSKKYKVSSPFKDKYKKLTKKYDEIVPYKQLYSETELTNQSLTLKNNDLNNTLNEYKSTIEYSNRITALMEDDKGDLIYRSGRYGFSLTFPGIWKNKFIISEENNMMEMEEGRINITYKNSKISTEANFTFDILIYSSREYWDNLDPNYMFMLQVNKIYQKGEKTIAYSIPFESENDPSINSNKAYQDMASEVKSIVKTIKAIN